jgi:hypothetical protein
MDELKTFQNNSIFGYQKTSNISRIVPNFRSFYSGINAEINELSGDMHMVAQYLV